MFERFAQPSRNAVTFGVQEASRRGDRRIGTDHLLLGVLHDKPTAELVGISVDDARATADKLDNQALAAIGLDVGDFRPTVRPRPVLRAPFTSGARSVMQRTLRFTTADRSRKILPKHLLLALLEREQPDPAAELLTACGVDTGELTRKLSAPGA